MSTICPYRLATVSNSYVPTGGKVAGTVQSITASPAARNDR
jgi:hypothetical protein